MSSLRAKTMWPWCLRWRWPDEAGAVPLPSMSVRCQDDPTSVRGSTSAEAMSKAAPCPLARAPVDVVGFGLCLPVGLAWWRRARYGRKHRAPPRLLGARLRVPNPGEIQCSLPFVVGHTRRPIDHSNHCKSRRGMESVGRARASPAAANTKSLTRL